MKLVCVAWLAVFGCFDAPVRAAPPSRSPSTTKAPAAARVPSVAIGHHQICVQTNGKLRCAGGNFMQLLRLPEGKDRCPGGGDGCNATFTDVPDLRNLDALALGFWHGCASGPRGLSCWGDLEHLRGSATCTTPTSCRVRSEVRYPLADVVELATSSDVTCARTRGGDVYCWGVNDLGLVGDGTTDGEPCAKVIDATGVHQIQKCRLQPTRVVGVAHATQLAMGMMHACAVIDDGTVRCWGANDDGQLGDGAPGEPCTSIGRAHTCRATPVAAKIDTVQQLATGRLHTCAVRRDGSVACWGYRGSIGSAPRAVPEPVAGLSGIVEVAAGFTLTCARAGDGRVSCWGLWPTVSGPWKQLATPTLVPAIEGKPVRLAAYESDYCVVVERGAPWCWGENDQAQLGVSTDKVIEDPMRLPL